MRLRHRSLAGPKGLAFVTSVFVTASAFTSFAQPPANKPTSAASNVTLPNVTLPNVTLPTVVEHVDAVYPQDKLPQAIDTNVEVLVTVERDGSVGDVKISVSGGDAFDNAALAAVRRWRFTPATRAGVPIRARIRVPFHFAPDAHPPETPETPSKSAPGEHGHDKPQPHEAPADLGSGLALPHSVAEPGKPIEIHVQGRSTPPRRGASDFRIDRSVFAAAPRPTTADLLRSAPGFNVMRPEGDAVAQRVSLRGFDADHGQDIQFSAGGLVPINQPSHIHGQGYADTNVLIPETVRSIRILEGVYDPHQGDFAVAGSVDFDLGVPDRGIRSTLSYGSFNTLRFVGVFAPVGQSEETFGAVAFRTTDGFNDGLSGGVRGGVSGGFTGQYRLELPGEWTTLVHVAGYGARSGIGGVVRRDDINTGKIDFWGTYGDTSARSQSADVSRTQASVSFQRLGDDGTEVLFGLWGAYATYRSRLNFTGYTQRSHVQPEWAGRGDLIEQSNQDVGVGARASIRTRRYNPASWLEMQLSIGADADTHSVDQAQNLLEAPQNETWDQRVDASIHTFRAGAFVDGLVSFSKRARLRGGARADFILFDIDDRLGNFIPPYREQTHLVGFRRSAAGIAMGPRATFEFDAWPFLRLFAAYGEGYRSPQGRQLEEGEQAPFAKVRSYEGGVKLNYERSKVSTTLLAYETRLSYDLAFDATEGRLERIGPTTRRGLVAHFQASPIPGLNSSLSMTLVRATLDSPPPPTPENPTPAYVEGQALPYVPPLVVRADVSYQRPLVKLWGKPLVGRIGYGATFLSSRPLPYAQEAAPVFTVDATAGLRRDFLEVGVDAMNLLNRRYADSEYVFVSDWRSSDIPSLLPARHISAGPPLTILGTLTLRL